jgi:hypothetical protein
MTWEEWASDQLALEQPADQTANPSADSALLEGAYGGSFAARATLNAYFEPTPWTEVFALPYSITVDVSGPNSWDQTGTNTDQLGVNTGTSNAGNMSWLNDVQSHVSGEGHAPYDPTIPWTPQPDVTGQAPVTSDGGQEATDVLPAEEGNTPVEQAPGADQGSPLQRDLPSEDVANAPLPEAAPVGPRNVPQDSNAYHITQFTSAFNPHGPDSSNNCGPASLAMAMLAFGVIPENINPNNRQEIVKAARFAMTENTDPEDLTNDSEVRNGADKVGLHAENVDGIEGITRAIDQGKLVVAGGNPIHYERALKLNGTHYGNGGQYDGGHFILIVGRHGDDFIINDPMSRIGKLTVSKDLLTSYIKDSKGGDNNGTALWPKA